MSAGLCINVVYLETTFLRLLFLIWYQELVQRETAQDAGVGSEATAIAQSRWLYAVVIGMEVPAGQWSLISSASHLPCPPNWWPHWATVAQHCHLSAGPPSQEQQLPVDLSISFPYSPWMEMPFPASSDWSAHPRSLRGWKVTFLSASTPSCSPSIPRCFHACQSSNFQQDP